MPKNPLKPEINMKKEPKSGISILSCDDGIVHIQKARKLTIKERKNHDKNKFFILDEIQILFHQSADVKERPKIIFSNRKYV